MMIDHMVSCTFTSADHGRFGYSGNAARPRQSKRMGRFQVSKSVPWHRAKNIRSQSQSPMVRLFRASPVYD